MLAVPAGRCCCTTWEELLADIPVAAPAAAGVPTSCACCWSWQQSCSTRKLVSHPSRLQVASLRVTRPGRAVLSLLLWCLFAVSSTRLAALSWRTGPGLPAAS